MFIIAIQRGRLSSAQRTKVIEEVKRLELQGKIHSDGTLAKTTRDESNIDEIVKLLTNTKLDCLPNTAEALEDKLQKEEEFIVWLNYV